MAQNWNSMSEIGLSHPLLYLLCVTGYKKFLNTILELPDVWIVPIKDGIEYMKASVTSVVKFGWSTFVLALFDGWITWFITSWEKSSDHRGVFLIYDRVSYGGPETGPCPIPKTWPLVNHPNPILSKRGLFSGLETKIQIIDYSSSSIGSNKKQAEQVYKMTIIFTQNGPEWKNLI